MFGSTTILNSAGSVAEMLLENFYENFAMECSKVVIEQNALTYIYAFATEDLSKSYPKSMSKMLTFRAAYILETVYFRDRTLFEPYIERFWIDFTETKSESAKRHFGKIMHDLLKRTKPSLAQCEAIAETCIMWATEPNTRVAVQIWAIEILFKLRKNIDWLPEVLPEILEPYTRNPSPAISSRLKQWRIKIKI